VMSKKKSILLSLLVMLLWGSLFPSVKYSYAQYGVSTTQDILLFIGIRFVICGLAVSAFAFLKDKSSFGGAKNVILPVLLSGLFSIVIHYYFTYSAMQITDSSKTAILKQVGSLFYVCLSFVFFKNDKVTYPKIIGAVLGFAGIVAINAKGGKVSFNIGDAMILGASFSSVAANIVSKKVFKRFDPIAATGISQFFGGAILLILGLYLGGSVNITFASCPVMVYICLASIVSYCLWYTILKGGELSKLLIIKFAEPVFACLFSAAILGENVFNIQYITAFLLISGGIYISNKK